MSKEWPCFYNNLKLTLKKDETQVTERTRLLEIQEHGNGNHENYEFIGQLNSQQPEKNIRISRDKRLLKQLVEKWKYRLSIYMLFFFYLVMNIPLCVLALLATGWIFIFREMLHRRSNKLIKLSVFIWYSVNLILIVRVAIIFFSAAFLTAIGLLLNGQTYLPYFMPLWTILFYSWVNWKSSVETKYLTLNKNIYEVCKNSTQVPKEQESDESNSTVDSNNINVQHEQFVIQFDDDGEPIIPKELYNKVREIPVV